jgi:DNA repair protein RadC
LHKEVNVSEDIVISKRLQKAGEILGVNLIDHIIINEEGNFVSLKTKGIVK